MIRKIRTSGWGTGFERERTGVTGSFPVIYSLTLPRLKLNTRVRKGWFR